MAEQNEKMTKTITVAIESHDLRELKDYAYKLCFAKKVGDNDYNVVWQSSSKFLQTTDFSWTPVYQVFATSDFRDDTIVSSFTKSVPIGVGQKVTLDEYGMLGNVTQNQNINTISFINEFGLIHPGLSQMVRGIDGNYECKPIYVMNKYLLSHASINLTPVEKVLIWFQPKIETGSMFSQARSNSIELDLTNCNERVVKYTAHRWEMM